MESTVILNLQSKRKNVRDQLWAANCLAVRFRIRVVGISLLPFHEEGKQEFVVFIVMGTVSSLNCGGVLSKHLVSDPRVVRLKMLKLLMVLVMITAPSWLAWLLPVSIETIHVAL